MARSTWLLTVHSRWGTAAESGSRGIRCAAPVIREAFKTAYAVPDEGLATRTSWDTASGMPELTARVTSTNASQNVCPAAPRAPGTTTLNRRSKRFLHKGNLRALYFERSCPDS
jgi:hypothetical protein